jgi:hypothetical protein
MAFPFGPIVLRVFMDQKTGRVSIEPRPTFYQKPSGERRRKSGVVQNLTSNPGEKPWKEEAHPEPPRRREPLPVAPHSGKSAFALESPVAPTYTF